MKSPQQHRAQSQRHRAQTTVPVPDAISRFAAEFGWWRVVAIPVLAVITIWLIVDIATSQPLEENIAGTAKETAVTSPGDNENGQPGAQSGGDAATNGNGQGMVGPDPARDIDKQAIQAAEDELPAGGEFSREGDETFRDVGQPGQSVGEGTTRTVRYAVQVENGVDTTSYGGDDAFATMVDATLADPRGWTQDKNFRFVHVAGDDNPDTYIRLTSLATTAKLCGAQLEMETSCHTTITGESTVLLNESRWVRGATPFEGDLGNYRQYLLNHEFGHAIGFASHQACGGDGELAPIMMQQTISLSNADLFRQEPSEVYPDNPATCEPNPWPFPLPTTVDPSLPEGGQSPGPEGQPLPQPAPQPEDQPAVQIEG